MTETTSAARYGLKVGTPSIRSVGSITFGPGDILFVADSDSAAIFALDVGRGPAADAQPIDVDGLDTRLAAYLGCSREDVFIQDMAVNPESQQTYLSIMRGAGANAIPVLLKLTNADDLDEVPLSDIPFAQVSLEDAPAEDDERVEARVGVANDPRDGEMVEPRPGFKLRLARDPLRRVAITDMAYVDGDLLVAGASNEEFSSTLRRFSFPFEGPPNQHRLRSTTSPTASTKRLPRSARSSPSMATAACWQAIRARRLCTSRSTRWALPKR